MPTRADREYTTLSATLHSKGAAGLRTCRNPSTFGIRHDRPPKLDGHHPADVDDEETWRGWWWAGGIRSNQFATIKD